MLSERLKTTVAVLLMLTDTDPLVPPLPIDKFPPCTATEFTPVILPVSVIVPAPCFKTEVPDPEMLPEKMKSSERLKVTLPVEPKVILPATEPLVPPFPIETPPFVTDVPPVYVLVPVSVIVPVSVLLSATVPLPFSITPLKVDVALFPPCVIVTAPATLLVIVPPPANKKTL